jgi:DNA-binding NarL/FixJ family response regulator
LEDYRRLLGRSLPAVPHPSDVAEGRDLEVLSRRERQVLELVAQGMTNPQIGSHLGISPKTVARHRERIMDKLDLHSSTGLVKYAIRTGLVEVD